MADALLPSDLPASATGLPSDQAATDSRSAAYASSGDANTDFDAGVGKVMTDAWLGLRQAAAAGITGAAKANGLNTDAVQRLNDWKASLDQEAVAKRAADAPLLNTRGGFWGNVGGNAAMAFALPAGAETLGARLLLGGGAGALQNFLQPTTADESRALNTGVGAVLGMGGTGLASAAGGVVRAAAPKVAGAAGDALRSAVDFATQQGVPVSWAQRTGSELGQRVEAIWAKLPGARAWYQNLGDQQRGMVDNVINGLTMGKGGGQALQDAGAGKMWMKDPQFEADLMAIPDQFKTLATNDQPTAALAAVKQYGGTNTGPVTVTTARVGGSEFALPPAVAERVAASGQGSSLGATGSVLPDAMPMVGPKGDFGNYQAMRSVFGKKAFAAGEGTPDAAAYSSLRNAFDDAAVRSLEAQGADPAILAQARSAYQVQKLLTPAEKPQADGSWTYDPQKAAGIIENAVKNGSIGNLPRDAQTQLMQMANFARKIAPPSTSGTAENQIARGIAMGGIMGAGGLGEGEFGESTNHLPAKLAGLALGLYGAPWLLNRAVQGVAGGVPGLRSLPPPVTSSLAQLLTGTAAAQAPALLGQR